MTTLTHANRELFRRTPDERFASMGDLLAHARQERAKSNDLWHPPKSVKPRVVDGEVHLELGNDGAFHLNDWSFSLLCGLSRVSKETVNRLLDATAARVLEETMPTGNRPLQFLTSDMGVRSVHGTAYTRLWNADLLNAVLESATGFQPPQPGLNGATGLYAGEQDMFAFLIDPLGWTEIGGQNFAPGIFVWNSEVGKRSVGISTFWFQAVCRNHIVWDAVEVVEVVRKHTARVGDALTDIRRAIDDLVAQRDARRDGFARVMERAMREKLGDDADDVLKRLAGFGIPRHAAKEALEIARQQGRFTIFALVDALTRLAQRCLNAGDRLDLDAKAGQLLTLAV